MELTPSERKRGLIITLITTFFMWGGFFMVIPLISVHYVNGLGWAASAIGIVLAVRQFTQQGLAVFGGMLSDRIGPKSLICNGLFLRAIGFTAMAWADNFWLLMGSCVLAALGGALFEAPRSAAIAAFTTTENRASFYSLVGVVGGLGMTVGPLVGTALLKTDFSFVCLCAGGCFFINYFLMVTMLPKVAAASSDGSMVAGINLAFHDRHFIIFTILLIGFWFLWAQINITLPLVATDLTGTSDSVGWMYALNSGLIVVLQYPLVRILGRWFQPLTILWIGMGVMSAGLAFIMFATNIWFFLTCIAIYSIGGMLISPTQQTVTAEMASPSAVGAYFGVNMLSLAVGGSLGNGLGSWMYDIAHSIQWLQFPWLICGVLGLVLIVGLAMLDNIRHRTKPNQVAVKA